MSDHTLTPRCYVCGKAIAGGVFVLAAMSTEVDRVFVSHEHCSLSMEAVLVLRVKPVGGTPRA